MFMSLSLSVCSQSGLPICTSFWAFFRAFKALRALKGPPIKFSHILMHRPYRDLQNLKFSCLYLFPFSHKVVYQKASGRGGRGSGRIPHFNWSIYTPPRGRLDPGSTFFKIIKMSRHKIVGNDHVLKDCRKVQVSRERQTFQLSRTLNKTFLGQQLLQI